MIKLKKYVVAQTIVKDVWIAVNKHGNFRVADGEDLKSDGFIFSREELKQLCKRHPEMIDSIMHFAKRVI